MSNIYGWPQCVTEMSWKNILNTRKKKKYHLWLSLLIVGYIQFMMSCKLEPLSLLAIFTNFFLWCGKCLTSHQPEEISISETSCDVFPVHFCKTIWVEDGPVASQTIGIWQCVTVVKKYWLSLSKSKQLKNNKFFDTLVKHHKDQLIIAKLQFLRGCLHVKFVTGMKSSLSIVKCLLLFTRFCRDERRGEISSRDERKKKRRVDTSCRDEILKWACFFNCWRM